jgi:hypothetical protein
MFVKKGVVKIWSLALIRVKATISTVLPTVSRPHRSKFVWNRKVLR